MGSRTLTARQRELRPLDSSGWRIVTIVLVGLAVRLWGVGFGLPDFLEEAIPFRTALSMWLGHPRVDWNPHLFDYPSLSIYLQLALQGIHYSIGRTVGWFSSPGDYFLAFRLDPTAMVTLGRLVGVLSDGATVLLTWSVARRVVRDFALLPAAIVALSAGMITASRTILPDSLQATLMMMALDRLLLYRSAPSNGRFRVASVCIGLAIGAKYPAVLLVVPLLVAWWAASSRRWPEAAAGIALIALAFLFTTPFSILDGPRFLESLEGLARMASQGHLGHLGEWALPFYARRLAVQVGWIGVPFIVLSVAQVVRRREWTQPIGLVALTFLLVVGAIGFSSITVERYLVPVIPLAAVLLAHGLSSALNLASLVPKGRALAWGVALPAAIMGISAAFASGRSTQEEAREWILRHLGHDDLLIQEAYGAAVLSYRQRLEIRTTPLFHEARPEIQRSFLAAPWIHSVALPLTVAGEASVSVPGLGPVHLYPSAVDYSQAVYAPELFAGARYVLTSGAVRHRFEADSQRHALQMSLYQDLDRRASLAARFEPTRGLRGPEIRIYRLPAAWANSAGVDSLWWIRPIPLEVKAVLREAVGAAHDEMSWIEPLRPIYRRRYAPFVENLSLTLMDLGRWDLAIDLAHAHVVALPDDADACALYVEAAAGSGDVRTALPVLERALDRRRNSDGHTDRLLLLKADVLVRLHEVMAATMVLRELVASRSTVRDQAATRLSLLARASKNAVEQ
jgi:hypothetical protein